MENLKKEISDFLESNGFTRTDDTFELIRKVQQPGRTLIINGQQIQEQSQEIQYKFMFSFDSECDIEDVNTGKIDNTIMCRFYSGIIDQEPQVDTYLNFYSNDIELIKINLCKVFGIKM